LFLYVGNIFVFYSDMLLHGWVLMFPIECMNIYDVFYLTIKLLNLLIKNILIMNNYIIKNGIIIFKL